MSVTLSPSTVLANAPQGTVIGTLSSSLGIVSRAQLLYTNSLPLQTNGVELVTDWSGTVAVKNYVVIVLTTGSGFVVDVGFLTVNVIAPSVPTQIVGDPTSIYEQPLPKGV